MIIAIGKHDYKTKLAYPKVGPPVPTKMGKGTACHPVCQRQEGCDTIRPNMTNVRS